MSRESFRSILQTGLPQLGLNMMYPSPGAIERIGPDWDWIWIDGQHGELGSEDTLAMVRACDHIERPAFVRVPHHAFGSIGLALDTAPAAIIVPVVDTPEEARAVVKAAKFPPLGGRSYGGRRPIDLAGRLYSDTANEEVLLVVQIESPEAIENADAIAALEGVDALFLGPDDIMLRRGYPMSAPRSEDTLGNDMKAVVAACRRHGKFSVASGGVNARMVKYAADLGFNLIVAGADMRFLAAGSEKAAKEAREIVKARGA